MDRFACSRCGRVFPLTDETVVVMADDDLERARDTGSRTIPLRLYCDRCARLLDLKQ